MRVGTFAVAALVVMGCGPSEATVNEASETDAQESSLTLTPPSTLLLAEPGARFVAASVDRSRVVVQGSTNSRRCAPLTLLDLRSKSVLRVGGADVFCGPFTLAPVFSPDARRLAVWAFDQPRSTWNLYLWDEAQPTLRKIATREGQVENDAELAMLHFSADGKHLVYVSGAGSGAGFPLVAWSVETASAAQVASQASLVRPRMSPDGARMLFLADGLGARAVMAWRFSTKQATELGRGHDWSLHVSPDGARAVFTAGCVGDAAGLPVCELREWSFTAAVPRVLDSGVRETFGFATKAPVLAWRSASGAETWNATSAQRTSVAGACWATLSGDGRRLAWLGACAEGEQGPTGELRVGAVGGTSSTKVGSSVARGAVGFEPTLNLDGSRLAWTSAGTLMLWSSGSSWPRTLALNDSGSFNGQQGSHAFSPDGQRLVFEKSTSWVNPFLCPPYGVCGYRDLAVRDVSNSVGSDRAIASGSAWSSERYGGLLTSPWAHGPDGRRFGYLATTAGTPRLFALQAESRNTYRLGRVEGSTTELSLVLGDGFAAVANGLGVTLYTGLD